MLKCDAKFAFCFALCTWIIGWIGYKPVRTHASQFYYAYITHSVSDAADAVVRGSVQATTTSFA